MCNYRGPTKADIVCKHSTTMPSHDETVHTIESLTVSSELNNQSIPSKPLSSDSNQGGAN